MKSQHRSRYAGVVGALVAVALVAGACGNDTTNAGLVTHKAPIHASGSQGSRRGSLTIHTQSIVRGRVIVAKVTVAKGGVGGAFVAVATDVAGSPSKLLGAIPVRIGTTSPVAVPVNAAPPAGRYFALLFLSTKPPKSASGAAVRATFRILGP